MADTDRLLEDYVPVVKYHGLNTAKNVLITGNLQVDGTTTIKGVTQTDLTTTGNTVLGDAVADTLTVTGASTIHSTAAAAFTVGAVAAGATPAFAVDASTASAVAGLKITGAATGGTVAVVATDSGADTSVTINAKGTGTIGIGSVSTGIVTITPATTIVGQLLSTNPVKQQTITDHDTQSPTLAVAEMLGGIIVHTSVTGAGVATVDTGTAMSTGVSGVAVGSTIEWLYYNDGSQTATITAAAGHTLVGGTAAVTTGKWMRIISVNTASNTWVSYLQTLM